MEFQEGCPLKNMMNDYAKLQEEIKQKSIQRLHNEGKDKDARLNTVGDR